MKVPEKIELPMIVKDSHGKEHEVARFVYVLEQTCKLDEQRKCSQCGITVHEEASYGWIPWGDGVSYSSYVGVKYCPNCGAPITGKTCDLYEGGETNWERLFGTPERSARTLAGICESCKYGDCCTCGVPEWASYLHDYDALLEWLRGDA